MKKVFEMGPDVLELTGLGVYGEPEGTLGRGRWGPSDTRSEGSGQYRGGYGVRMRTESRRHKCQRDRPCKGGRL